MPMTPTGIVAPRAILAVLLRPPEPVEVCSVIAGDEDCAAVTVTTAVGPVFWDVMV